MRDTHSSDEGNKSYLHDLGKENSWKVGKMETKINNVDCTSSVSALMAGIDIGCLRLRVRLLESFINPDSLHGVIFRFRYHVPPNGPLHNGSKYC
jgi:hypothetical protein